MALDLETLRTEVDAFLASGKLAVFYASHRAVDPLGHVYWDVEGHPDFREFLTLAEQAGVRLVVFHHLALSIDQIDEALEELQQTEFSREEKRQFETRLRKLREYEGFTCSVELSFSLQDRTYVFEVQTDWYESLNDILAELDAASGEEEEEDNSLGGYFSNN